MAVVLLPFSLYMVGLTVYEIFIKAEPSEDARAMAVMAFLCLWGGVSAIFLLMGKTIKITIDKNQLKYQSDFKHLNKTYEMKDLKSWGVQAYKGMKVHLYFPKKHLVINKGSFVNFDELLGFLVEHFPEKQNKV